MAVLMGYLSLVVPFVFVYSFLAAIKEILHDGEKGFAARHFCGAEFVCDGVCVRLALISLQISGK